MVNFFQLPKWLLNTQNIKMHTNRIDKLGIGSEEWAIEMLEEYHSIVELPKTDTVNSYNDFVLIREISEFLGYEEKDGTVGYPMSIYAYALLNQDKILRRIDRENYIEGSTLHLKYKAFRDLIVDPNTYYKRKHEILELVGHLDLSIVRELRDSYTIFVSLSHISISGVYCDGKLSMSVESLPTIEIPFEGNAVSKMIKIIEDDKLTLESMYLTNEENRYENVYIFNYSNYKSTMKNLYLYEYEDDYEQIKRESNYNLFFESKKFNCVPKFLITRFNRGVFIDSLYKCDRDIKHQYSNLIYLERLVGKGENTNERGIINSLPERDLLEDPSEDENWDDIYTQDDSDSDNSDSDNSDSDEDI